MDSLNILMDIRIIRTRTETIARARGTKYYCMFSIKPVDVKPEEAKLL